MTYRPNNNLLPGSSASTSPPANASENASSSTSSSVSPASPSPISPFAGASAANAPDRPQTGHVRSHRLSRALYFEMAALSNVHQVAPSDVHQAVPPADTHQGEERRSSALGADSSRILGVDGRRQRFEQAAAQALAQLRAPMPVPPVAPIPSLQSATSGHGIRGHSVASSPVLPAMPLPPAISQPSVVSNDEYDEDDGFEFDIPLWSDPPAAALSALTDTDEQQDDDDDFAMPEIVTPVSGRHAMSGVGMPVAAHVASTSYQLPAPALPLPAPSLPLLPNVRMLARNARGVVLEPRDSKPRLPPRVDFESDWPHFSFKEPALVSGIDASAAPRSRSPSPVKFPPKGASQDEQGKP